MKPKRILVIDGHPDPAAERFLHALTRAYVEGARAAGHEVRTLAIGELDFPLLVTAQDFAHEDPPRKVAAIQLDLMWADHLVLLFPLWLGSVPAKVKGLLEQLFRPGFAFEPGRRLPKKLLAGKSARVVVTMGMPGFFYKLVYRSHGLKCVERNILAFCGFRPIRSNLIGRVEGMTARQRAAWIARMRELGEAAR